VTSSSSRARIARRQHARSRPNGRNGREASPSSRSGSSTLTRLRTRTAGSGRTQPAPAPSSRPSARRCGRGRRASPGSASSPSSRIHSGSRRSQSKSISGTGSWTSSSRAPPPSSSLLRSPTAKSRSGRTKVTSGPPATGTRSSRRWSLDGRRYPRVAFRLLCDNQSRPAPADRTNARGQSR